MSKILPVFMLSIVVLLLFGCVSQPQQASNSSSLSPPSAPPNLVGGDRDSHGCIGSAGYTWCDALSQCIRPWEENCTAAPELVGGDRDSHGCIGSAGYSWCPETGKCVRVWEENCPSLSTAALEAQAKTYCAGNTTVYICGIYIRVVSDMPGAGSAFYTLGNYDPVANCPLVAPDAMSEQCNLLLFGNNCVEKQVECSSAPMPVTTLKDDPSFVGAQLSWSAPDSSAVDYAIYRGNESLMAVSLIKTTGQTSYNDVFNGNNQTFAYFVRARNANGVESKNSNIIYVRQLSTSTSPSPGQID